MKALYHNTRGPSSSCCQLNALIQAILPCLFLTPGPGTWFHPANLLTSLLQCSTTSLLAFFFSFFWQLPHLFLIKFQSSSCLHSLHPSHGLLFSYAFMGVVCGEKHKSPLFCSCAELYNTLTSVKINWSPGKPNGDVHYCWTFQAPESGNAILMKGSYLHFLNAETERFSTYQISGKSLAKPNFYFRKWRCKSCSLIQTNSIFNVSKIVYFSPTFFCKLTRLF